MNDDLVEKATRFIQEIHISPSEMYSSILKKRDEISLSQAIRLADSDYGRETYKWELKYSALLLILNWEERGILSLREMVLNNPSHPNISVVSKFLAYVASGRLDLIPFYIKGKILNKDYLNLEKWKTENIRITAQSVLVDLMKNIEKESRLPMSAVSSLFTSIIHDEISDQIFSSLVIRWFNFNRLAIEGYLDLIQGDKLDEVEYHNFLKENPYLIEPFHSKMWSKPKFGEGLQPDFLFRLMDDSLCCC